MSWIINSLIFLIIFSYAIYTIVKFFKQSRKGKCGSCGKDSCCDTQNLNKETKQKLKY